MFKIWISFYLLISRFFRGKKKKKNCTIPSYNICIQQS